MKLIEKKERFKYYIKKYKRDYQVASLKETINNKIGQFLFPTGTGKTYIQKYIHAKYALLNEGDKKFSTNVIVAHRLLLCWQLLKTIQYFYKGVGLNCEVLFVGSGENNDLRGLMNEDLIKSKVDLIKKNNKHVIIVSTYHSFDKLILLDKIDVCTFDEAHNIVIDDPNKEGYFKENLEKIKPIINKEFYFTATPKTIIDQSGDIDKNFFGPILNWMSPREAINKKYIVEPALLIGETFREEGEDIDPNNKNIIVQSIKNNFEYQEEHSKLSPKILIVFKNIEKDLIPIYENEELKEWCKEKEITRLMFSSKGNKIDNVKYKNLATMLLEIDKIKEDPNRRCLFMHYDILSEGIDIPNMTGILLFRDLEKREIKFIQNVGRCCRPQPGKKYAYVSIPDYLLTEEKYKEIILQLYTSYDFKDYTDIKIFIGKQGKNKNGSSSKSVINYRSEEAKDLIITNKLLTFDFDIAKKNLEIELNNSDNKEQFLNDLLDDIILKDFLLEGSKALQKEREYFIRNPKLREECLKKYGSICYVCGEDLKVKYGKHWKNVVEMHHEKEFADYKEEHKVYINDLKIVEANCHNLVHIKRPCYTMKEAQEMILNI
jgi:superfamily II DNA or RNA helicase